MKTGILLSIGFWTALIATICLTGCAGLEVGGRAGIYRVDEQTNSSRTYRQDTKPVWCMFSNCAQKKQPRYPDEMGS